MVRSGRAFIVVWSLMPLSLAAYAQSATNHDSNNLAVSSESVLGTGTLYATYAKVPLVEGHGSYFDKAISLQDPITKEIFDHSQSILEIIDPTRSAAIDQCGNLSAAWSSDAANLQSHERVCAASDYLVKVWPSASNQSKAYSCVCVAKESYQSLGTAAQNIKGFPVPAKGRRLSLFPLATNMSVFRPDGSTVSSDRLGGVFAQDLGPGPVYTSTGTRVRYMRLFVKNSSGEFIPISAEQDTIYQVVDSGLVSSDIPARSLVARQALKRSDSSNVTVDRVSSDMWLRPKYIDPQNTGLLQGAIYHSGKNGTQTALSKDMYTMPIDLNEQDFGLLSRMRTRDHGTTNVVAKMGEDLHNKQVKEVEASQRPARTSQISAALPIVSDMETARKTGYYNYGADDNYVWGRPHIIWNVQEAGRRLKDRGIVMGIGDVNIQPNPKTKKNPKGNSDHSESHANTPGHTAHHAGLCVDMRLIFDDGVAQQGTVSDKGFNRKKTFEMIKTYIDIDSNIQGIYVNDSRLLAMVNAYLRSKGLPASAGEWPGHDNHVHIGWRS